MSLLQRPAAPATLFLAVAALLPAAAPGLAGDDFAVQAGHVITADGKDWPDGGTVLVRGGRVEAVEKGAVNPWGVEVRSRPGAWLLPGFVEAESQGGLERGNEQAPNTPFVSVLDGLDPLAEYFQDLLREGVTTVFVVPGDQTLLGGQGLVLKPVGRTAEEMIVERQGGLKVALAPRPGTSRMGQMAELRRALDAARRTEGDRLLESPDAPRPDPRQEALWDLLQGKLPAVFACDAPVDVENAVVLMERYGLRGFLSLSPGCHRALPTIAEKKLPVLLPADLEPLERDPETGREFRVQLVKEFHAAGVPVVLQADERSSFGMRSLWYQAATAVSQGLSREDALRAVTLNPARLLGVDDRVGVVAPGRDANLVLWTGDPLDPRSWVEEVYVEGSLVYERSKDQRLRRLLDGLPRAGEAVDDPDEGSDADEGEEAR